MIESFNRPKKTAEKNPKNHDVYRLVSEDQRVLGKGTRVSLAELQDILGGKIIHKKDLNGLRDDYDNRG